MADEMPGLTREQWLKIAWSTDPPEMSEDVLRVLQDYSHVPADQVIQHVSNIRDKAFKIYPYPCIGRWRFLNLAIGKHPQYQEVKTRMLTGNEIFLDLGCAFAQDVRKLVADGVDSAKCYGSDLRLEFLDLGYELFQDKDTLKTTFLAADIFNEDSSLSQLHGKVNIINASSFFHLFSWDEQKQIARRCVKMWTGTKDDLMVGRQMGNAIDGEFARGNGESPRYRHNIESWNRMWEEVGDETGIEFDVQAKFIDVVGLMPGMGAATGGLEEGTKMVLFSVRRI